MPKDITPKAYLDTLSDLHSTALGIWGLAVAANELVDGAEIPPSRIAGAMLATVDQIEATTRELSDRLDNMTTASRNDTS